jgi:hypothetical protein
MDRNFSLQAIKNVLSRLGSNPLSNYFQSPAQQNLKYYYQELPKIVPKGIQATYGGLPTFDESQMLSQRYTGGQNYPTSAILNALSWMLGQSRR